MVMPGREYGFDNLVHGFNGQLRDKDIQKDHHTAMFWEYDPRSGRRWNIDPVTKDDESPYMTLGNNPIVMIDPNGADWYKNNSNGAVEYKVHCHKQRKGYEYLGKGNGDVLVYNGNEYNKKTGAVRAILDDVIVTAKTKAKPTSTLADRAFPWVKQIYSKESKEWSAQRLAFEQARNMGLTLQEIRNQDILPEYRLNEFERVWQVGEDSRALQVAVFVDLPLMFVPVPKVGMLRWLGPSGKTFNQAKAAIWARNTKPVFQAIRNETTGQTFKVFAEIHHKYVPQRWKFPNWITNSRLNLQITNSIEHGLRDPYRWQFFPRWIKEGLESGTISAESVIRIK